MDKTRKRDTINHLTKPLESGDKEETVPITRGQYHCPIHQTTVIVTKVGEGQLRCGQEPLVPGRGTREMKVGETFSVPLGKRYSWPAPPPPPKEGEPIVVDPSRTEVLCTLGGDCTLSVDEHPMLELQPKVLPSAD